MKKRFLVMAMTSIALAGCVNNEVNDVVHEQVKQKISFGSPLAYDNSTRAVVAGEISNPYPQKENFMIYATEYVKDEYEGWTGTRVSSSSEFFNNTTVSFDTSVDGWAPKKAEGEGYYYWVDGNYMAFAACSPAELGLSETNNKPADSATDNETQTYRYYDAAGLTITNFKVNDDSSQQYDLLFSERIYNQDASNMIKTEGQYSGIQLKFQHALSSIHFSLLNETLLSTDVTQHETIILKSISIKGVNSKGTFNENIVESNKINENGEEKTVYNMEYDKSTGGNVTPSWTGQTDIISGAYKAYTAGTKDLEFPSVQQYVSIYITKLEEDNASNKGLYGSAIPLLLLPQTIPADAVIEVKYQIKEHTDEGELTKEVKFHELKDNNGNPLSTEWKIGTKYTYRLVYSKETSKKDRIYFAPSVDGWLDGGIIIVNL